MSGPDGSALVPVIGRNVERLLLLVGRDKFEDVKVLDRLVVAGPHFHDLPVHILVAVPLPDLDDLFRVRALGPFDDAQKPIGLLGVGADVPGAVFEEPGVERAPAIWSSRGCSRSCSI